MDAALSEVSRPCSKLHQTHRRNYGCTLFVQPFVQVSPASTNEPLLADASESLGSACVMNNDLDGMLEGAHRRALLDIAQVVMLRELAVNQVLDNLVPVD
jgi:hypothetical protein